MSKLPAITGKEAMAVFKRAGFSHIRTTGSHFILAKEGHLYHLSIPVKSGKVLGKGLLRALVKAAGLTEEEFITLLRS